MPRDRVFVMIENVQTREVCWKNLKNIEKLQFQYCCSCFGICYRIQFQTACNHKRTNSECSNTVSKISQCKRIILKRRNDVLLVACGEQFYKLDLILLKKHLDVTDLVVSQIQEYNTVHIKTEKDVNSLLINHYGAE